MNKINLTITLFFCLFSQLLMAQNAIETTFICENSSGTPIITNETFNVQLFDFSNKRYRYLSSLGNRIIHTGNVSNNTAGRWEIRLLNGTETVYFNETSDEATPPCDGWIRIEEPTPSCQFLTSMSGGCSQPPIPPNATFPGAINLPFQELCENPTLGTVFGAVPITTPGCSAVACDDDYGVWYEFTVPGNNPNVVNTTISVVSEATIEYAIELRSSPSGGGPNMIDCAVDTNGEGIVNLSGALSTTSSSGAGIKYWVRVYPRDCTVPVEATADFSICVSGLPSVSIPDANGFCLNADAGFNSVGDDTWKYLTKDGKLLFGLLDSEALGMVEGSFYNEDLANPRMNADMQPVVNRNFTVTPASQPINPVRIRLFISQAEYDNFIQNTNANSLNDLLIYRHSDIDICVDVPPTGGVNETILAFGNVSTTGYYLELEIASFSAFFVSESSSVLPVSWESFEGKRRDKTEVSLEWSTSFEQSNAYFELERSENNLEFESIGRIEAKGYSEETTSYRFTDTRAPATALTYRLRQVDMDGTVNHSKIIAVSATHALSKVRLFPNPARQEVQIEGMNDDTFYLRLVDMYGQTVRHYQLDSDLSSIPVYDISTGVYLLEGRSKNGMVRWTERLVIAD